MNHNNRKQPLIAAVGAALLSVVLLAPGIAAAASTGSMQSDEMGSMGNTAHSTTKSMSGTMQGKTMRKSTQRMHRTKHKSKKMMAPSMTNNGMTNNGMTTGDNMKMKDDNHGMGQSGM